jgi:hypothetical protein
MNHRENNFHRRSRDKVHNFPSICNPLKDWNNLVLSEYGKLTYKLSVHSKNLILIIYYMCNFQKLTLTIIKEYEITLKMVVLKIILD